MRKVLHIWNLSCIFVMETKTNSIMSKESILIDALNTITINWRLERDLFAGGCAYAAAIIAKEFKKMGIHYEIIAYNDYEINVIEYGCGCAHIAVRVEGRFGKKCIGGEFKHPCFTIKTNMGEVEPEILMKYYKTVKRRHGWNDMYSVCNNSAYSRICNKALKDVISL